MDIKLIIPDKMLRQATVFLILFSLGGALKSIAFNDLIFTPQDCIGASITVSILMYMEIYKTEAFYESFLTFGNKSKSVSVTLIASGLILSIPLIVFINDYFLTEFANYFFPNGNPDVITRSLLAYIVVGPVYFSSYLIITVGFCMITIPILRVISIKVFGGPQVGKKNLTNQKKQNEKGNEK